MAKLTPEQKRSIGRKVLDEMERRESNEAALKEIAYYVQHCMLVRHNDKRLHHIMDILARANYWQKNP